MKKLLIMSFVVLALAACSNKAAETQEGIKIPLITGKVWNYNVVTQNKPVVVTVMAGFCGYCKMMAPLLDKMAGDYKGKNVEFIFAFVDEDANSVKEIVKGLELKNATIAYNSGPLSMHLGVRGFPATYLVHKGEVVGEWSGYSQVHIASIKEKLNPLI